MSETESLLSCPFCGGSAGFVRVTRGFGVIAGCNHCQASVFAIDENNPSDIASHRKLAVDAWNRRDDTIPRATVAAALPESWYADSPLEFRIQKMVEQWQKLHKREKEVAAALRELRAKLDSMMFNERHKTPFDAIQKAQVELNATIASLGLADEAQDCPECGNSRQVWRNQITGKMTCHRAGCHKEISK